MLTKQEIYAKTIKPQLAESVAKVQNEEYRNLLDLYLVQNKPMAEIKEELFYSRSSIYRLLQKAMAEFKQVNNIGD